MATHVSRRDFAKATACASLGAVAAGCSNTEPQVAQVPQPNPASQPSTGREFPKGFFWGTATASYQIEGAWNEDLLISITPGIRRLVEAAAPGAK